MGMHGQGQPEAREFKAGPIMVRKRSVALSNLYVIMMLTRAAKGKGSVAGELPPAKKTVEL